MEDHEGEMIGAEADSVLLLTADGYTVVREELDPESFGNALVLLNKGTVNVRLVRERGQWFADISFTGDPAEWFDSAVVFRALGEQAVTPAPSLDVVVKQLVASSARVEGLFSPDAYATTKSSLRAIELASAQERFGYSPK
jgi:hypothetical protein